MLRNGSVPLTPASTGVCFTTGSTSRAISITICVGVAIGHQAGERAAAGHAVAAGIVDHDEVDAAGFLAFGGQAGAGAAADDRLAARDHVVELVEDGLPFESRHRLTSGRLRVRAAVRHAARESAATSAAANAGSLM